MAKKVKTSSGAKLSIGYKITLWIVGGILFLAFAFATFCACGGLSLISGSSNSSYQLQVDENGDYFYYNEDGEKIYLSDLVTSSSDAVSGTDVSDSDAADDASAE